MLKTLILAGLLTIGLTGIASAHDWNHRHRHDGPRIYVAPPQPYGYPPPNYYYGPPPGYYYGPPEYYDSRPRVCIDWLCIKIK